MRLKIIFFFLCFHCFAQKPDKEIQVMYQLYIDGVMPITYPTVLYVKDNETIYQSNISKRQLWDKNKAQSEMVPYASATIINDGYLKINHLKKELLTFELLPTISVLVTDTYPEMNWVIAGETKNIAGYNCIKATTSYRGRNWTAWFTPDISMPYGPWKLHGLPGLILEAYDVDKEFIMQGTKVEYVSVDLFERDFAAFRITHNKKPITYKQFLADRNEAFENIEKKMRSDGIDIQGKTPPPSGLELKYEWE